MTKNEKLSELHNLIATVLTEKIISGEATSSDLNVARQFLKDNGIDASTEQSEPLHRLTETLPFDPDVGVA